MSDTTDQNFFSAAFTEHLKQPPPEFLYHYTGQDGLLGIIATSSLWATNILYLNDTTEFRLSLDLIEHRLSKEVGERSHHLRPARNRTDLMTMLKEILAEESRLTPTRARRAYILWNYITLIGSLNIYATCFCECGDLLSQWRGYASSGYGYALGFKTLTLQNLQDDPVFLLGRCIYDRRLQETIVEEAIEYVLDEKRCEEHLVINDFMSIVEYGAFFKHSSFLNEQEWRLVCASIPKDNKKRFRQGKSMIIPHTLLNIGVGAKSSLNHIRVGPCPHMALSRLSVQDLLSHAHIKASVKRSAVPFRDW